MKSVTVNYVVLVVVALLAFCPVQPEVYARPVMLSPLAIAIRENYSQKTVELLIDRYPYLINGRNIEWDRFCPLVAAAYEGKTNLVELLIRKGANVNYAIQRLQEIGKEEPIALVLSLSKNQHKPLESAP